jgi:tRNA 2-thiouridine synthesizing protein A
MHNFDNEIDVTGTSCPVPLIQVAKAAGDMSPGQVLKIIGDDPIFEKSIRDFCEAQGLEVLELIKEHSRKIAILIKL